MPVARAADLLYMFKKQTAKRRKDELLRDKKSLAVREIYINALSYNDMFYSAAYWNTSAVVHSDMENLNSKSYKLLALKGDIRMRVICSGW